MFLIGIFLILLMPFQIFEYSISPSELDLTETSFFILLIIFVFQYIKLCRQITVPLVWKIISPWVHQAHMLLLSILLLLVSVKLFDFGLDELDRMPLLDLCGYVVMVVTMGYSYYRMKTLGIKQTKKIEIEGATE